MIPEKSFNNGLMELFHTSTHSPIFKAVILKEFSSGAGERIVFVQIPHWQGKLSITYKS
jgi:hypothetical protein